MLRRSTFIQSWSGVVRSAEGKPRVTFTWEPTPVRPGIAAPDTAMLVVTATTPRGDVLFDGNVTAVGTATTPGTTNRAEFEAPAGRVLIDIKILNSKGIVLDTDSRDLEVPKLDKERVTLMPVALLRAGSAREFRAVSEDPDAAPVATREFRRTERLLVRVPAYEPGGEPARVSATLLNRWRQPMRARRRCRSCCGTVSPNSTSHSRRWPRVGNDSSVSRERRGARHLPGERVGFRGFRNCLGKRRDRAARRARPAGRTPREYRLAATRNGVRFFSAGTVCDDTRSSRLNSLPAISRGIVKR